MRRHLYAVVILLAGIAAVWAQQQVRPCYTTTAGCVDVSTANPLPVTPSAPAGTQNVNVTQVAGAAVVLGQAAMAASFPVTVASNQSAVPSSQSGTWTVQPGNTANTTAWLVVKSSEYPSGAAPITGNATGTTGAVVGTLANASAKTTFICGFDVSAIGGTAAVGPVTVAGLVGSSMVYQLSSTAAGITFSRTFTPCIPASATNTAITVTTTADGTASAVDVNSWGYQL